MPPPSLPTLTPPFSEMVFKNKSVIGSVNIPPFKQLAFIGAHMVQFCIMNWLKDHRPDDMMDKLADYTNKKPSSWGKSYRLRGQCSISNSRKESSLAQQPTDNELFRAYIGALLVDGGGKGSGYPETNQFIQEILDYEDQNGNLEVEEDDGPSQLNYVSPLQSHPRNNLTASTQNGKTGKSSSGSDNDTGNFAISMLHEKVAKAGGNVQINWIAFPEGKAHDPTWTMEVCIDGSGYKGTFQATDKNKKQAKIIAAKLALEDQRLAAFLKLKAEEKST